MKKKTIVVVVEGGVIQNILHIPRGVRVQVRDYDAEGEDRSDPRIKRDRVGDPYYCATWENGRIS